MSESPIAPARTVPCLVLRRGEADRVLAGHPWVYAGSVQSVTGLAADGELVEVWDHRRRFLGTGLYHSRSKIQVRMVSSRRVNLDTAFFIERFRAARAMREWHLPGRACWRLIHAEGDFLSGLVVDRYQDVFVLQTSSLGMERRKPVLVEALQSVFAPRAILERNDIASRKLEGLPMSQGVLTGTLEEDFWVEVNGLSFVVDLLHGHKTGLYLDQQVNWQWLADVVSRRPGGQVLDCFAFSGGFGLHAARAGAQHVHFLDQSEEATAIAKRQAERNGVADRSTFESVNVFDWLKAKTQAPSAEAPAGPYDVIILDPPSFTRTRSALPDALRGYKEIHLRALRLLKPGGLLVTFCCSHHVDAVTFQDVILSAAFDARKILRRRATFTQSPDHPIIPSIPETEYLKGYALELVR